MKTPLKRIYYIAQLALAGEVNLDEAAQQIEVGLLDVKTVFERTNQQEIDRAFEGLRLRKFFVVMRALKKLFFLEEQLLAHKGTT